MNTYYGYNLLTSVLLVLKCQQQPSVCHALDTVLEAQLVTLERVHLHETSQIVFFFQSRCKVCQKRSVYFTCLYLTLALGQTTPTYILFALLILTETVCVHQAWHLFLLNSFAVSSRLHVGRD